MLTTRIGQTDREWTKEETDYLFERVKEYDLRWHIIADRYDYPGGKTRTMEVWLSSLPFPCASANSHQRR